MTSRSRRVRKVFGRKAAASDRKCPRISESKRHRRNTTSHNKQPKRLVPRSNRRHHTVERRLRAASVDVLSCPSERARRLRRRRLEDKFEDLSSTRTNCDRRRRDVRSDTDLRRQSAARQARGDDAVIGAILSGLRPLPSCPSVCPLFLRRRERSSGKFEC